MSGEEKKDGQKSIFSAFDAIEAKISEAQERYGAKSEPDEHVESLMDQDLLNISLESVKSKRGRPFLQDVWTRVIDMDDVDIDQVASYPINTDLLMDHANIVVPQYRRTEQPWAPLFHTTQWKLDHPGQTI